MDHISTNRTKFFRDPEHFTYLTNRVFPDLVPSLLAAGAPLRVWSAAASSGEEAYTLAITLAEFCRQHPTLDWQVEATDISHRMTGLFSSARLQPGVETLSYSLSPCWAESPLAIN